MTARFNEAQHARDRAGKFAARAGAAQAGRLDDDNGDFTIAAENGTVIAQAEHHDVGEAAHREPRTWEEIEDQAGGHAKARLFSLSGGRVDVANRIRRAYAAAGVDQVTEPGTRTLLLDPGGSGYAPLRARLVLPGDRYGRDDCLVCGEGPEAGPLIEFYDTRYSRAGWPARGQFVDRYYTADLNEAGWTQAGINLGGGSWKISAENTGAALLWAAEETDRRAPADGRLLPPDAGELEPPF